MVSKTKDRVLSFCAAVHFWGDVKTINSGKRYVIRSNVSEKESIVYTFVCIESSIIEQYHFDQTINDHYYNHTWNEDDCAFGQQLEKWFVRK